jgi:hypothetical protein
MLTARLTELCARTEAEYAYRLHKDIVPLIMQPKYKADGWLGALLGNKLYFDISDPEKLTTNMPSLMIELERRIGGGVLPTQPAANNLVDTNTTTVVTSASSQSVRSSYETCLTMSPPPTTVVGVEEPKWYVVGLCITLISPHFFPLVSTISGGVHMHAHDPDNTSRYRWSSSDVLAWLTGFSTPQSLCEQLAHFDGAALRQLRQMKTNAPANYYTTLRDDMHFDTLYALQFTDALDKLP